jgi:dephospho-CoA kinase
MIIGLIGEKLSGKDTVAKYLERKYEAEHIRHSQLLDEMLEILDLPKSRRNEIDLGMGLRRTFGDGILGKALAKRVGASTAPMIVINGIRFQDEVDNARKLGAKIIYITAPEEVRYERFLARKEKTDDASGGLKEFQDQEQEPTEIGIPGLGGQADFRIDNTGTSEKLNFEIDLLVTNLKASLDHPTENS